MKVIGITGRLGSGKSSLCGILERRYGCPVIHADALGHEALRASSRIRADLVARFGDGILAPDGSIDRGRLAGIVFADGTALSDLNALTHPWILGQIDLKLRELRDRGETTPVLIDAALLPLWRHRLPLDRIVCVRCPEALALARLRARGVPEEDAARRLASQPPEKEYGDAADLIVDNDGDPSDLEREAERLWRRLGAN